MATADEFSKEMDQIKKDFASLRNDIGSILTSVKDLAEKQGQNVSDLAHDAEKTVKNQAKEAGENMEKYIEERPLTSALVAFGSGFIIGMLLSNRR
ncbi:DUF883 family protein [Nitrosomonas ureae]|uniref:ElaB/YqjD/DUF883 family membrane-anchored ribosome-binding protein n=1 Tax=Nitrosomonas ureae TaxID=44577 RepID=A0A0S3AIP1_9PROT|nr:DUF883 family protein [Nitrosomonas ureae]ALQ50907.1 hypothetical protein ATY38_06495 [Nitrosomonas ureae]PTQ85328.1 ElaB/YqjD/DUF883 family membrane-anchored ribosome-binding protein [Nitrosomonas ureae]PXX11630.1 ElaB/YqjD/DUF883 family membrane-anchored ribosome-binding protein [Nitrosomonas ureae]SDU00186.1 Membrane-anchored ribosome-binding protein, inhibits growth in stationary phase, ElaB/YqjD/DUF883 family [Nitrosomonas ureae]SEQ03606.1 Membrane-anchored ribosome-binding protein, in